MKDQKTLRKLLSVIVEEWGIENVRRVLEDVPSDANSARGQREELAVDRRQKKKKLSAVEIVKKSDLSDQQKTILLWLANRYDSREFLPNNSDIREMLFSLGGRLVTPKDRSESFRVLLQSWGRLPLERLAQIEHDAAHFGPSELGPLSDAIAEVGAGLTRNQKGREMASESRSTSETSE